MSKFSSDSGTGNYQDDVFSVLTDVGNVSTFHLAYIEVELFLSLGSSMIPTVDVSRKAGNAWNIPHSTDVHYASTDASLFSSSLPIFSHKKCMFELLFNVFGLVLQ